MVKPQTNKTDITYLTYCQTPIGKIAIAENEGAITQLYFPINLLNNDFLQALSKGGFEIIQTPLLQKAAKQLDEYFAGERQSFDLPLKPRGTEFQQKIWQVLQTIPYGEVWSYGKVGAVADCPKGYRAVGMANNKNPIPIIIPCHRVVGANSKLVGFGGGLDVKDQLLVLEKADLKKVVTK